MQRRFEAMTPPVPAQIVVINEIGAESATASVIRDRGLPFLQDTTAARVWAAWGAHIRELWIVDGMGRRVEVIDLSTHSLTDPANATNTEARILAAAGR